MDLDFLIKKAETEVELRKTKKSEDISLLSSIVEKIIQIAPKEENLKLENLFNEIVALNKFTGEFYNDFINKTFPFSKRVMRHAVDVEPYYNNNDQALEAYLIFAVEEMGLDKKKTVMPFIQHVGRGHFGSFYFELISDIRLYDKINPSNEIKENLIEIFKTTKFYETKNKVLLSCVYFGITEIALPLKTLIREYLQTYEEMETTLQNQDIHTLSNKLKSNSANISYFLRALSSLKEGNFNEESGNLYEIYSKFNGLDDYQLNEESNLEPYKKIYDKSKPLIQRLKQSFS